MLKRRLLCLTILALLTVALATAHADVTLTYKMTKGQILRYQCTTTGNGTITATGRTGPVNMNSTFDYVMTCTGVDEKGNLTVLHAIENLKAEAYWDGQQLPVDLSIPKITTVIAPNGTTLSTQVHREPAPATGAIGLGGSIMQASQFDVGQFFGELHGPGFPKESVKPEQRWKQSLQLKTQSGQPMVVNYTTSFLDYAKLRDTNPDRLRDADGSWADGRPAVQPQRHAEGQPGGVLRLRKRQDDPLRRHRRHGDGNGDAAVVQRRRRAAGCREDEPALQHVGCAEELTSVAAGWSRRSATGPRRPIDQLPEIRGASSIVRHRHPTAIWPCSAQPIGCAATPENRVGS